MPALVVNVAIISNNRILLTKRDDFEVWCLPGGGVEEGESVAQAAIRETKEETGLDVKLTSLVGIYSNTGAFPSAHAVLFTAVPIGGEIQIQPGETIDVCYFTFDDIPDDLSFGHRKKIEDARNGIGGSIAITHEMVLPMGKKLNNKDIIEARKIPREARLELYQQVMKCAVFQVKIDVSAG